MLEASYIPLKLNRKKLFIVHLCDVNCKQTFKVWQLSVISEKTRACVSSSCLIHGEPVVLTVTMNTCRHSDYQLTVTTAEVGRVEQSGFLMTVVQQVMPAPPLA